MLSQRSKKNLQQINVALVSSNNEVVKKIQEHLQHEPIYPLIWIAINAKSALDKAQYNTPDLIIIDINVDGVEITKKMSNINCPVLIITNDYHKETSKIFDAMAAGALDVVDCNLMDYNEYNIKTDSILLKKLNNINRLIKPREIITSNRVSPAAFSLGNIPKNLVAIGASTGGPIALADVLSKMKSDLPTAIVIIQHLDAQFANGFIEWLDGHVPQKVKAAREGEIPTVGTVLVPKGSDHLVLQANQHLHYTANPIDYVYRPSVNEFFDSVAKYWQGNSIGVLLTGMGRDGANGLLSMYKKNFHTIAQDEASSAVYGMPKAAVDLKATNEILTLDEIGTRINQLFIEKNFIYAGK